MPSKSTRSTQKASFNNILIAKIDDYMDRAFATEDQDNRQKYREAIREMEKLLVLTSELE